MVFYVFMFCIFAFRVFAKSTGNESRNLIPSHPMVSSHSHINASKSVCYTISLFHLSYSISLFVHYTLRIRFDEKGKEVMKQTEWIKFSKVTRHNLRNFITCFKLHKNCYNYFECWAPILNSTVIGSFQNLEFVIYTTENVSAHYEITVLI